MRVQDVLDRATCNKGQMCYNQCITTQKQAIGLIEPAYLHAAMDRSAVCLFQITLPQELIPLPIAPRRDLVPDIVTCSFL